MANNGKETWADAIDKARDHFNAGWKELANAAELAKSKGAEAWEEAQEKGRDAWVNAKAKGMEMWDDAETQITDRYEQVRERGDEILVDAEKLVKKHPKRALGLSILVGLVFGAVLCRDRD